MVVAFSRFKVANGREVAVREAFLNRPRLVDNVSGFLGLEVFADTEDAALFYLITRWTDRESFQEWHSGADHNHSHKGIPKGLKLDPSFTLIRTLDRISAPAVTLNSDGVRDYAPVISEFLNRSAGVFWLRMQSDGIIVASNPALAKIITGTTDSLNGAAIWSLLTAPDATALQYAIESGSRDPAERHLLNFVGPEQMPFTFECNLVVQPGGFVLIGEAVQQYEVALQVELVALNNQLAVSLRENERKTKALRMAKAEIDRALKDLQESYWHVRKLQEFLPICSRCGKVKTDDSNWEEFVDYLKRNSLFLSHGYCPACLAKEVEALDQRRE